MVPNLKACLGDLLHSEEMHAAAHEDGQEQIQKQQLFCNSLCKLHGSADYNPMDKMEQIIRALC
jgi:hypothetical protein